MPKPITIQAKVRFGRARKSKSESYFPADLCDRAVPQHLAAEVEQAPGPVEILVKNAGVGSSSNPHPLVDFDDDLSDQTRAPA